MRSRVSLSENVKEQEIEFHECADWVGQLSIAISYQSSEQCIQIMSSQSSGD